MEAADLDAVATTSAAAFDHDISDDPSAARWRDRLAYPLSTDPDGAFVAEGAQQWAIDVMVGAGLGLTGYGALCVRGHAGPLVPFIPSGPFI